MIFNMIVGGNGSMAELTVTAPVNATVTISKDGKTKTKIADADGIALFKGLDSGVWSVEISDGTKTITRTITISTDYAITMSFFSATISVTYPSGSTCTCSDGTTTLTAPDTTGNYVFTIYNSGAWIVCCTDGTNTDTETVLITEDGQSEVTSLTYWNGELFDYENRYLDITGGWINDKQNSTGASIVTNDDGSVTIEPISSDYGASIYRTAKKIDLTNWSLLHFYGKLYEYNSNGRGGFGVYENDKTEDYDTIVAQQAGELNEDDREVILDISGLEGSYHVGVFVRDHANYITITLDKMWLT